MPHDTSPLRRLYAALHAKSLSDVVAYPRWTTCVSGAPPDIAPIALPLSQLLYRAIVHYVACWEEFTDLVPHDAPTTALLRKIASEPYRPGTYRPDFLFDTSGEARICEINARFPLNMFLFSLHAHAAEGPALPGQSIALQTLTRIEERLGSLDTLALVHDSEPMFDAHILREAAAAAGLIIPCFTGEQLPQAGDELFFVNELTQEEILALPEKALSRLSPARTLNDLRTVFLVHDKRFLALLGDAAFLRSMGATAAERALLQSRVIPSFTLAHEREWSRAKGEKDAYVLKHAQLGKGRELTVGRAVSESRWARAMEQAHEQPFVLQRFVPQRTYAVRMSERVVHRYLLGGMLCFDEHLLGSAVFRVIEEYATAGCYFIPSQP